jgi:hypothetical protein
VTFGFVGRETVASQSGLLSRCNQDATPSTPLTYASPCPRAPILKQHHAGMGRRSAPLGAPGAFEAIALAFAVGLHFSRMFHAADSPPQRGASFPYSP